MTADERDLLAPYASQEPTARSCGPCVLLDPGRVALISFVAANGKRTAVAESTLSRIEYFPKELPEKMLVQFKSNDVTILGRHLGKLYDGLCAREVSVVTEVDELHPEVKGMPLVTRIAVVPRQE